MRVLMLAQFFRPVIGGEERAVEDLAGALRSRGHDVAVATLRVPGTEAREERDGVRIHRLDGLVGRLGWLFREHERRHLPPLPDPGLVAGLARVLADEQPEIVHAHNWIVHSFLPLKRKTAAPLVLSLHDYSLVCATKRLMRFGAVCDGPGAAKCLRCAVNHYRVAKGTFVAGALAASAPLLRHGVDMYLPVSWTVAERLELARRGLPFEVVPNLLPPVRAADEADPALLRRLPPGDFLLFLGDATADKGALVALEAHRLLPDPPPLVLIGRPLDLDPGAQRDNVLVLGPWPHAAAVEALRRCLLLLAPSIVPETFGLSALEAMAQGRPVVGSRLGGLAELISDRETGRLVEPGDPVALGEAIAELLADRSALEAMGERAHAHAASFSADRIAPRVEDIYRSLCAAGSSEGALAYGYH
jgi:glycosyltransferase involved in cell wall biosynthesis